MVPYGYADGFFRCLSNRCALMTKEGPAPQLGKICMDMCMIDLTGKMGVDVGSEVEVFGKQNSIMILRHLPDDSIRAYLCGEQTCAAHLYQKLQSCGERTSVKRIEEYGCGMEIQMNKRTADYIADQLADQILSGAIRAVRH